MRTAQLDQIVRQKDPELLKAVEHLARNEDPRRASPCCKLRAVLQNFPTLRSASPPSLETTRRTRKDVDRLPRQRIAARHQSGRGGSSYKPLGALGKEERFLSLCSWLERHERRRSSMGRQLQPGDTLQYIRGSQQLGLKKNTYTTVLATDPANNLLTVARADGQHVVYDPQRLRGVNVYTNLPCEFSTPAIASSSRTIIRIYTSTTVIAAASKP